LRSPEPAPEGYLRIEGGDGPFYVRADLEVAFREAGLQRIGGWCRALAGASQDSPGRGGVARLRITADTPAILKALRRGGLTGPLWRNRFSGPRRVLDNLWLPLAAIERDVPTPAPLALLACAGPPGLWRGWLAVREIEGGEDLVTRIRRGAAPDGAEWGRAVAAVRALHDAGIEHPDLNLGNLLVVPGEPGSVWILDLDGARLHDGPLPVPLRARGLMRLRRSYFKTTARAHRPRDPVNWAGLYAGDDPLLAARLSPGVLDGVRAARHRAGRRR